VILENFGSLQIISMNFAKGTVILVVVFVVVVLLDGHGSEGSRNRTSMASKKRKLV
jgi:hypothetical protein